MQRLSLLGQRTTCQRLPSTTQCIKLRTIHCFRVITLRIDALRPQTLRCPMLMVVGALLKHPVKNLQWGPARSARLVHNAAKALSIGMHVCGFIGVGFPWPSVVCVRQAGRWHVNAAAGRDLRVRCAGCISLEITASRTASVQQTAALIACLECADLPWNAPPATWAPGGHLLSRRRRRLRRLTGRKHLHYVVQRNAKVAEAGGRAEDGHIAQRQRRPGRYAQVRLHHRGMHRCSDAASGILKGTINTH